MSAEKETKTNTETETKPESDNYEIYLKCIIIFAMVAKVNFYLRVFETMSAMVTLI